MITRVDFLVKKRKKSSFLTSCTALNGKSRAKAAVAAMILLTYQPLAKAQSRKVLGHLQNHVS